MFVYFANTATPFTHLQFESLNVFNYFEFAAPFPRLYRGMSLILASSAPVVAATLSYGTVVYALR